jgi:phosphoglycerate dehydrogenase-like enzyme
MPNVAFITSVAPQVAEQLTQAAGPDFAVNIYPDSLPDDDKIVALQPADFLLLFPSVISDQLLRAASHLKLIQLVSAGFDQINLDLCRELAIPLANNGGANSIDVAEHTLTLILSFYRRLLAMDHNVRHDGWRTIDSGLTTYTIFGKTAGIVGLGNIGQQTAARLRAFGAELLFYDPYPPAAAVSQALGARQVSLEELLRRSDIVTLHVPLMPATKGLINARTLALMKPTALLVNTCRGPVVDEAALVEALQAGRIAGAALDVLAQEPPDPQNPLLKLGNVLLTPHTAGVTFDTWARRGDFIFQNFRRVWAGEPPLAQIK